MQYTGLYGTDNIWIMSTVGLRSRWNLYSIESITGNSSIKLQPESLQTKSLGQFNNYLVFSAICTGMGNLQKVYGELPLIRNFLNTVGQSGLIDNMQDGEIERRRYSELISLTHMNMYIGSASVLTGLEYKPVGADLKDSLNKFRYSFGKTKIKSYEDIIKVYDTAWMYNTKGESIKDYRLITSIQEFEDLKLELKNENPTVISFDTETTGINFLWYPGFTEKRSEICGCSISWKVDQGVYIVFKSTVENTVPVKEVFDWLVPFINERVSVAHNAIFDMTVLYSLGYYLKITHDTMLMEFNLDSTVSRGSKGLKVLTRKYYNHETLELEEILGSANPNYELVPEIDGRLIKIYACADTDYCLRLFFDLKVQIDTLGRQCYQLDIKLFDMLMKANFYGSHIDMKLLELLAEINTNDITILETLMYKFIRDMGSRAQARKMLKINEPASYEPTSQEIEVTVTAPEFIDLMDKLLQKQTKKGGKIQLSSSSDMAHVMFSILNYPVYEIDATSKQLSTDDAVLTKLIAQKTNNGISFLSSDVESTVLGTDIKVIGKDKYILQKSEAESCMYPFAYMLQKWRSLDKMRSSFFNVLLEGNTQGWYYTRNSMTSAETARVINPIQTLEGSLKKLIIPYSNEYYQVVFDMAQIEFRVMLGLANIYWKSLGISINKQDTAMLGAKNLDELVERLNNPEKDYHREGGAIFAGCTPEDMTSEQRGRVKAVHFSVPFGAGAYSISESALRTATTMIEQQTIVDGMEVTLAAWRKNLYPLAFYLEHVRKKALMPVGDEELPNALKGGMFGKVTNPMGRVRYFPLEGITNKEKARITRQVGNFPIQSLAREIFFIALHRLNSIARKKGYIKDKVGEEKFIIHNPVHDEATLQVHKSIHPYEIYNMILDSVVLELEGFPKFYMGIAIVDNWYEGKDDRYEAPVNFVKEMAKLYRENPDKYNAEDLFSVNIKERVLADMTVYMNGRFHKYIKELQSEEQDPYLLNPVSICGKFKDYFLKSRVNLYTKHERAEKYCSDSNISKGDMKLLISIDGYIKADSPYEYAKYRTLINGEELYLSDLEKQPEDIEFELGLDDTLGGLDVYLDDLDSTLDFEDDELRDALDYYASMEVRNTYSVNVQEAEDFVEDFEYVNKPSDGIIEDYKGRLICDVTNLLPAGITALATYLKKFRTTEGKPLYFGNYLMGTETFSGCNITDDFDQEVVREIILKYYPQPAKTQIFR